MQNIEILQKIEGLDEMGETKAICSVSIQKDRPEQEPEVMCSAFTKDAVLSVCLTPLWAVVDMKFADRLDYDLFQMTQVCMEYSEMIREDSEGNCSQAVLLLSITPAGEYEQFVIGRNGFWSLMSDGLEKYCDTLRFIFPREQFEAYELTEEAVEQMIAKASEEVDMKI